MTLDEAYRRIWIIIGIRFIWIPLCLILALFGPPAWLLIYGFMYVCLPYLYLDVWAVIYLVGKLLGPLAFVGPLGGAIALFVIPAEAFLLVMPFYLIPERRRRRETWIMPEASYFPLPAEDKHKHSRIFVDITDTTDTYDETH